MTAMTYGVTWTEDERMMDHQSVRGVPVVPVTKTEVGLTLEYAKMLADSLWLHWATVDVSINREGATL